MIEDLDDLIRAILIIALRLTCIAIASSLAVVFVACAIYLWRGMVPQ